MHAVSLKMLDNFHLSYSKVFLILIAHKLLMTNLAFIFKKIGGEAKFYETVRKASGKNHKISVWTFSVIFL